MKKLIIIFIISLRIACAEPFSLPVDNQGWWTPGVDEGMPGVGVPGGIFRFLAGGSEDRAVNGTIIDVTQAPHSADNTGASDATAAIQSAINSAIAGDVVYLPAGNYRLDSALSVGADKDHVTLRGAGSDTILQPTFAASGSGGVIRIGTIYNSWDGNPKQTIIGPKQKGITTLSVADASRFTVNRPAVIYVENELNTSRVRAGAAPTFSSGNFPDSRKWVVIITGTPTTDTITIDPPLLIDCTDYITQIAHGDFPSTDLRYFGVEDFSIKDFDGASESYNRGIVFGRAIYCWAYNISMTYQDVVSNGNCMHWMSGFRNEVRKCTFICDPTDGEASFSDGAIQYSDQTGMLVIDNIFATNRAEDTFGWDVGLYCDYNASNCAYLYNFFEQTHKTFLINHTGGHSLLSLFEGNVGPRLQHDGYFTSTSHHTLYRNWFSGRNMSGNSHPSGGYVSWFKRFSRKFVLAGNVWGWDNTSSSSRPQYGYPNIGNDSYSGMAQPTADVFWEDWADYVQGTYTKGVGGFQEIDLDVEASFELVHNYESNPSGTGIVTDMTSNELPDSLAYATQPAWWNDEDYSGTWPPINPDGPVFDPSIIPAGYRHEHVDTSPSTLYALPVDNQGWWTPGVDVGVDGGVEQYLAGGAQDRAVSGNVLNVTQPPYDADNTGVTSVTDAVKAALADAQPGDVVFFPEGTYLFSSGYIYNHYKDEITIRGAGAGKTTMHCATAQPVFFFNSSG